MGIAKELFKKALLSTGYELKKNNPLVGPHNQAQIIENFIALGSIPWSEGYIQYKEQEILKVLNDKTMMQEFVSDINLSAKFGFGLDERIIEYPWFFSQVANFESLPNYYLDAGPVMNHEFLVERASKLAHTVHFTTLNHEDNCYQELDISYLFSDLVNLPIKNEFYGDHAYTFAVGEINSEIEKLLRITKESLYVGIKELKVGKRTGDVGFAIQQ